MFPYDILPGIDLYVVFLSLAAFSAIVSFGRLADRAGIERSVQNLSVFTAIAAIIIGYGSAVAFQALYNIAREGKFVIDNNTGATFYGGLIGGAATFIIIYFVWGYFRFDDKIYIKSFLPITEVAVASITLAHSLGRIGCLMAGCCHGKATSAWFGIKMAYLGYKVVPIQLFEAIFLIILFALFVYRIYNDQKCNLPIYMMMYGAWRFIIEYARDDYRGSTFISFLTPSQFTAIIMIVAGIVLYFVMKKIYGKKVPGKADDSVQTEKISDITEDAADEK
jgi:phosphatidylglycerol:prolipoprotein diacylglycerol transferase